MGEFGENKKGQNLETIISKLSREQPNGRRNSFMLISGIDHSNVMFHIGAGGQDSEGEDHDPDMFQCGRCKQMFTSLQKYLKHKASKDCNQQHGQRSRTSPVLTNGEVTDSPDENNFIQSPTKRRHERKGIARRVSNFSSEGESISPEAPAVVVSTEQTHNMGSTFPVQVETSPNSSYHDFSNSVASISVAEALRSQSPVVVHPSHSFSPSWNSTNNQVENVNPPTMASSVRSQHSTTPVVNPIVAFSVHPPIQPVPRSVLAVPQVDQMWSQGPRFGGMPPMEIKTALPHPAPPMTRSKKGFTDSPPLVVHLKDRGRPVRAKETGLTEEELTDEIVTSSGQKVYRCKKCDKEFSFSSRLKRHLLVHTGARPFECPVCSRRFTQAVDLKRHMLRHSGQKPHVCHFCGKQYTRGDRLKVHLLSHTQEEKEDKPYHCSRCSASFIEAEQLRLHVCELQDDGKSLMETSNGGNGAHGETKEAAAFGESHAGETDHPHKFYRCEECNAGFTKYTSLKSHLLKHTGEKKYKCEHCNKTFFSSSSLKIHVRVHTGDRPFKCKDCPRKFSDPSNFNKHKRWHTKQRAVVTGSATVLPVMCANGLPSGERAPRPSETESTSTSHLTDDIGEQCGAASYPVLDGSPADDPSSVLLHDGPKEDLHQDLFSDENENMEAAEDSPVEFKSPEVLLNMAPDSTDTLVKDEDED